MWSLALRRSRTRATAQTAELIGLIKEGRVPMFGAIRQEVLSAIRSADQHRKLRDRLRAFSDEPLDQLDYEEAAPASTGVERKVYKARTRTF